MKKFRTITIIAVLIGVLAFIKIKFLSPEVKAAGPQNGKTPSTIVTIYVAKTDTLGNNVFATGSILANEEVTLMSEISGKVVKLNISEGNPVIKGDLLVKIDDDDFQAQLKKSQVQCDLAAQTVNRQKQLLEIKGISQEEFDLSVSQLNSFKADVDFAKAQIAKTEIRAPFNGIIGLKSISEGSFISPTIRIASIQQIDPVKIDFSIPEQYADVVHKNDELKFTLNGINETFSAKIFAIEPKIDYTTRTIQIRAISSNKSGKIFPGAFAEIKLQLKQINDAIVIPTEAIIPVLKDKKVFICKDGKAQLVLVQTGIRTAAGIQIVKGINPGDSVITTGIMQLKPDGPVKAIKVKK